MRAPHTASAGQLALRVLLGTFGAAVVSMALIWTLFNLALGCRTWDRSLWTETSSCIAPSDFLRGGAR